MIKLRLTQVVVYLMKDIKFKNKKGKIYLRGLD